MNNQNTESIMDGKQLNTATMTTKQMELLELLGHLQEPQSNETSNGHSKACNEHKDNERVDFKRFTPDCDPLSSHTNLDKFELQHQQQNLNQNQKQNQHPNLNLNHHQPKQTEISISDNNIKKEENSISFEQSEQLRVGDECKISSTKANLCHECGRRISDRWIMKLCPSGRRKRRDESENGNGNEAWNMLNGTNNQTNQNGNQKHTAKQLKLEQEIETQIEMDQVNRAATDETISQQYNGIESEAENHLLFHENCLKCTVCSCLLSQTCFVRDSKLFCPRHYYR